MHNELEKLIIIIIIDLVFCSRHEIRHLVMKLLNMTQAVLV